ncbi:phage tail length tape measure family protein [uncultured Sphingomonas sp.]|uniref:phage tail length tape measure family protein n=1 Tax=uncultured Sphingomonas sp. TaxID=158754 RepID=UPI0025D5A5C7|nr:phage tail length tape measure family protein [uncultured Sphingomonas sp.]
MNDDLPGFGVDFQIDAGDSYAQLAQLDALMKSTEAKILAQALSIEKATKGMIDVAAPTASVRAIATETAGAMRGMVSSFDQVGAAKRDLDRVLGSEVKMGAIGPAATREAAATTREINATEKSIERMIAQIDRETTATGRSKDQVRALRAEELALTAARQGNTDAADRLLKSMRALDAAQRAGAEDRAQAARIAETAIEAEAQAVRDAAFAYSRFELAAREGMAAARQIDANAAAAERLRASTDPLYAATKRVNDEIAESTRLYRAGAIAEGEYLRQQSVLTDRLNAHTVVQDTNTGAVKRGSGALTQLSFQLNDVATMAAAGSPPFQILATQAGQVVQVFQMAEGGAKGLALEIGGLLLRFAPLIGIVAAAGAGLALFTRWVNQGVTNNQLTKDLGDITGGADATKQELYKLKDSSVSFGSTMQALFSVLGKDIAGVFVSDMAGMGKSIKAILDDITGQARHDLAAIYAGVAGTKAYLGEMQQRGAWVDIFTGKGVDVLKRTYGAAYDVADKYLGNLGARVKKEAINIERHKLAEKIGFNAAPKPKTDKHADQLAREAAATEAQIRNLYKLADAYGVSGAAALIAEARVKAESEAIKKRADIEERVARQVRLAVAQRVSDSAKSTAGMRDEALIQEQVNAGVADGSIAAERANQLLRDRIADLPLLAAIEAARTVKDVKGTEAATAALEAQRSARDRLSDAQRKGQLIAALATGDERLAELREELRLVGATEEVRVRSLAVLRATQEASRLDRTGPEAERWIQQQGEIAVQQVRIGAAQRDYNDQLTFTADKWDAIASRIQNAGQGMADAFGEAGRALGGVVSIYADYRAQEERADAAHRERLRNATTDAARERENRLFAIQTGGKQVDMYGDMASAAKGFFKEGSTGYRAMAAAEKIYRVAQLAMSLSAMVQNTLETTTSVANAAARASADGAAGVAAQAKLPFPLNIAAMAATAAALVAAGVAIVAGGGGGSTTVPKSNTGTGTGTVLGDVDAKSESIKRSINQLREVDTVTSVFARQMAGSLRSIDDQIGGLAAVLVRSGNIDASSGVTEGFKSDMIGSILGKVPVIGGFLSSLFGSKTTVLASGLYGAAQSVGGILSGGFDASTYSDVQKKKKLFGITTSTKTSTSFGAADADLERQFTLILGSFASAIAGAAGPLGEATGAVESRLNGFVVNIGKIDLKGLTGAEIQEKLEAVFGAAADGMAEAAFPGISRFQKAGEGAFETLVRVASTLEAVTTGLDQLGASTQALGIDAKLALVDQFDSVSDFNSAIEGYFSAFYTDAEQAAAKAAQMGRVFDSLGLAMPTTLAGFRQLVEAQDLTTAAGHATYATLLQLAPAFADLQSAMQGTKSAADVAAERADLERKILELNGDTAALRALDLAKLDASNRGLQEQIYAIQDAQEAAKAADELRKAWTSVGDSIMDEVKRIRGLNGVGNGDSFATLMAQFNAANAAARAGDQDAAKSLPALSQALLGKAADVATSRQELARVQAQTAAMLEATYGVITGLTATPKSATEQATSAASSASAVVPAPVDERVAGELVELREATAETRRDMMSALATIAGNTGRIDKRLERVTEASGGEAVSVAAAA